MNSPPVGQLLLNQFQAEYPIRDRVQGSQDLSHPLPPIPLHKLG